MKIRVCEVCGDNFKAFGKRRENTARYCSMQCRSVTFNELRSCYICSKKFRPLGSIAKATAKFCSVACKAEYQSRFILGANHPRWKGGSRSKVCEGCGKEFHWTSGKPYISFKRQKYCTGACAREHGGLPGELNPNWRGGLSRRDMNRQKVWSRAVLERDDFTCQWCARRGGDLHAHHILGYSDHPDTRWDLDNGITLCLECHYTTYTFHSNQYK